MATSKCHACGSTHFEVVPAMTIPPLKSKPKFVQCSECGAVVGVVDEELKLAIERLERAVSTVRS